MPDSRRLVVSESSAEKQSLSILDTTTGDSRTIYTAPATAGLMNPAVSPDGRRIAFMGGTVSWDLIEIQIPTGRVQVLPSGGGVSWWPAWAPNGAHYAYVVDGLQRPAVRDVSAVSGSGGFARTLVEVDADVLEGLKWAPDGNRLAFSAESPTGATLMVANASGGRALPVAETGQRASMGVWSPDGQWLAFQRRAGSEGQLVKIHPASASTTQVLRSWPLAQSAERARFPVDWSPDGRWILAERFDGLISGAGLYLVSADGQAERQLSASRGGQGRAPIGFSRDGRAVWYLEQNTSGTGVPWRLWSIDVTTGAERPLADVPLPQTASQVAGFSLNPDGTRLLTSVANWPFDIWMLEGFDGTGLDP
jgi:Tol biopolymer transport system component